MTMYKPDELVRYREPEELLGFAKDFPAEVEIKGKITEDVIREISKVKKEPEWMLRLRLKSLELFNKLPMPNWLKGIEMLDLDTMAHYVKPDIEMSSSWDEIPKEIREYYEKIGIPELEARILHGLSAQYESETIYHKMKKSLEDKGVVMIPMEEAVQKYPDVIKRYFLKIFPPSEHKFAALHGALWSGGVFVYIPKNVRVEAPIEAFFLIGRAFESQFEHTLLIADENSYIYFIEGCTAPMYKGFSFHDGMVELYAHRGAHIRFTTFQNWSKHVINFNNKRAIAEENARVDWVEGSIGSMLTYVYPSTVLRGRNSSSRSVVFTLAKGHYMKDSGSKMIHIGENTKSRIVNKSISMDGGINIYRGVIRIPRGARNAVANVECESLILDDHSYAYTYPHNQIEEPTASVSHEATTLRLTEDQIFYLASRGLDEDDAKNLLIMGFLDELFIEVPFEVANILKKVLEIEFEKLGGVG